MRKLIVAFGFVLTSTIAIAQPKVVIVGPAYTFGSAKIDGYSFTRDYGTGMDGQPTMTFSNSTSVESKSRALGIMMDLYTKHSRVAFDLMFPMKNTPGNPFNFNLAFGGYIKKRIGILVGGSYYANTKKFNGQLEDYTNMSSLEITSTDLTSGNFYNDNFFAQAMGVNALFTIALGESSMIRFDYGIYVTDITNKKNPLPEKYDWNSNGSRKFEASLVMQAPGEPFGIGFKYVSWTTKGQMMHEAEYTFNNNTQTVEVPTMVERTFKLTNFMISLMIPLGNASSTVTTITVL